MSLKRIVDALLYAHRYTIFRQLYKRPGVRPVIDYIPPTNSEQPSSTKPDKKRLLFAEQYQKPEDLPADIKSSLSEHLKTCEPYEVELKYENFDASNAV